LTIVKERLKTDRRVIKADGVTIERLIPVAVFWEPPLPETSLGPTLLKRA